MCQGSWCLSPTIPHPLPHTRVSVLLLRLIEYTWFVSSHFVVGNEDRASFSYVVTHRTQNCCAAACSMCCAYSRNTRCTIRKQSSKQQQHNNKKKKSKYAYITSSSRTEQYPPVAYNPPRIIMTTHHSAMMRGSRCGDGYLNGQYIRCVQRAV